MSTLTKPPKPIIYPDSDGKPMAENTLQYQWIVTIQGGLDALFAHDPNVFVAGDLLWYPRQGFPKIRQAPDAMVVIGRHKGHRSSYLQWLEGGIAPQVAFEILSPGNTPWEMTRKFHFYETYGLEEYYVFDPQKVELFGWVRENDQLKPPVPNMQGWLSPRLGTRFELTETDLLIIRPDGQPFVTFVENAELRAKAERERERERQEKERERQEKDRERQEKEQAQQKVEKLLAKFKAMGIDPDQ